MTRGEWFIDKESICDKMCISKTYFEEYFMKDARMRSFEFRKGRKVLWETEKAKIYMKQIITEVSD